MPDPPAPPHDPPDRYRHQAALYGSDEQFLAQTLPFLREGQDLGEPTLVSCITTGSESLIKSAIPDLSGITVLPASHHYASPAAAIRNFTQLFSSHLHEGARRIRILGEVPHPGSGAPWEWWARYEATVNHAFEQFPVWGICAYDTRTAPPKVIEDILRVHPFVTDENGRPTQNELYEEPRSFLTKLSTPAFDPVEQTSPEICLVNPTPAQVRADLAELGQRSELDDETIANLLTAVSEAVTNALTHGRPPTAVKAWLAPGRLVVTVSDAGPGPADPFAGMMRAGSTNRGFGLWIAHQVCSNVTLRRRPDGFTIGLVAGEPYVEPAS